MPPKKTQEDFIQEALNIHGDKYDYSKVKYINSKLKITIICKIHGEFEQIAHSHLRGVACRKCGTNEMANQQKLTTDKFIKKSKEIYNDFFDYSKCNYIDAKTNIIVICPTHGDIEQLPKTHFQGRGCIKCNSKINLGIKLDNDKFIEKANEIHGNKYNYSKIKYNNYKSILIIICDIHGEFLQKAGDHLSGCGCIECSKIKISNSRKISNNEFIKKAQEKHSNLYDYSKSKYVKSNEDIIIICKIHGEFLQKPNNHLNGAHCSYCKSSKVHELNSLLTKFPDIATEWHPTKNKNKLPKDFMPYSGEIVWWICNLNSNHNWQSSISNRTNLNRGCPKCSSTFSKISIEWLKYLEIKYNIIIQNALSENGEFKIPNTKYRADGYCLENNTIYEFHGSKWHGDPRDKEYIANKIIHGISLEDRYKNTQIKKHKILELGYNSIEMWEYDWKNFIDKVIKVQIIYRYYH